MQAGLTMEEKLAALRKMTTAELRREWQELNGEPARSYHRQWLYKRLCWMHQAAILGGLSPEAERRIQELLPQALAMMPWGHRSFTREVGPVSPVERARLRPGTTLTRAYKGKTVVASVRDDGQLEYDGNLYRSLSAVAKAVTGSHWNGNLFFFGRSKKGDAATV